MTSVPLLVGCSGPDGSGKSTLVRLLAEQRWGSAASPLTMHPYGCFLCRRQGGLVAGLLSAGDRRDRSAPVRWLWKAHTVLDLLELGARLFAAVLRGHFDPRRPRPVLTDRTPLDGLVKHGLDDQRLAGRGYLWLARRYRLILWLDAPASELAARDRQHSAEELECARSQFRRWSESLPGLVVRVDTAGKAPATIAREAAWLILDGAPLASEQV